MSKIIVALCVTLALSGRAFADPVLTAFSGTVIQPAGLEAWLGATSTNVHTYKVLLYEGSSSDPTFNTQRKLLATAETDSQGHFVLLVTDLRPDRPVTVRAKNVALSMAGEVVLDAPTNGTWPQVSRNISITLVHRSDPAFFALFGIRNNHYARMKMYFVTDRQAVGSDFANTAAADEVPRAGTFMAHVALGSGQAIPGKCGIAPDWQCDGPPVVNDDGFIDQIKTTGSGPIAHTALRRALTNSKPNDAVLLFIHGYNNSFDQGAEHAARLGYLIDPLPHTTVVYSWPSEQRVLGYPQDFKSADLSANRNLVWVLDELANSGHPRLILAAHSMGSYALTTALYLWALQHPASHDVFSDLVLFAGDLDVDLWKNDQAQISRIVRRIKFYSNVNDQALQLSTCTTGDKRQRVGQRTTWSAPVVGFDATKYASTNGFGHGYLVESTSVALDWNKWIYAGADVSSGIRRLGWLNDGGGSIINGGKITRAAVCSVFSHIHF